MQEQVKQQRNVELKHGLLEDFGGIGLRQLISTENELVTMAKDVVIKKPKKNDLHHALEFEEKQNFQTVVHDENNLHTNRT